MVSDEIDAGHMEVLLPNDIEKKPFDTTRGVLGIFFTAVENQKLCVDQTRSQSVISIIAIKLASQELSNCVKKV